MNSARPMPKGSIAGSGGQLWRGSGGWRLALMGAILCTGLYLLNPPWAWHKHSMSATVAPLRSIPAAPAAAPGSILAVPQTAAHPAAVVQQPAALAQSAAQPAPMRVARALPFARAQPEASTEPQPVHAGISSRIALADQSCGGGGPMMSPLNPPPPLAGRIVGFVPRAVAMELIPRSEQAANGKIDPAYIRNLRAIFHPRNAPSFVREAVIVPTDMTVYVGEDVRMVGGHASPTLACHYVPNLIVSAGSPTG